MPVLLFKLQSIRSLSRELHPTTLYIYDDYMIFVKRGIIKRNEATISYNHVSQVYLKRGYIAASMEIINTGGFENIEIEWLPIGKAKKAKTIIDQRIFQAHSKHGNHHGYSDQPNHTLNHLDTKHTKPKQSGDESFESYIARLRELKIKGVITEKEFEKRYQDVLKSL